MRVSLNQIADHQRRRGGSCQQEPPLRFSYPTRILESSNTHFLLMSSLSVPTHSVVAPSSQKTLRVAIQGVRGAFHEIAAREFFGPAVEPVPASSFPALFAQSADPAQTDAAVLAIENSIAGTILGNYMLLQTSDLVVIGEVFLRIQQNLLALPGVPLNDLQEVHSHPMALAQCADFFKHHPHIRLVESEDTAASAAHINRQQLRHVGAIASTLAAELYGLDVLAPSIEDNPVNFTRFLAVQRRADALPVPGADKVSVSFVTSHQPGSLSRILSMLATQSANLTKIQSVPLLGRAWEYRFFVDFSVRNPNTLPATLRLLDAMTADCKVLGIYRAASNNYEP